MQDNNPYATGEAAALDRGAAVLRVGGKPVEQAIKELPPRLVNASTDAPGLIIDLRDNGGGSSGPGAKSAKRIAFEQQGWFRRGHDWRAGIEGRISGLKRRHKLNRCRNHGDAGTERWPGWGLIAHHLRTVAQFTAR